VSLLEIRALNHAYNGTAPVLRNVSFRVEQGEFVGIIGLSGSGKSTLLRCVNRLIDAQSGEILVPQNFLAGTAHHAPVDILKLGTGDLRRLRRRIGMIFQQFNLAKRLSVMDNVLCGALGYQPPMRSALRIFGKEQRRQALLNLERVGLLEHAYKRADELSGGEQQRVAIARTLMQHPALILADEPVSSLDPRLSRLVLDLLKRICREDGITALVSLHTLELTREYADRVIGLRAGEIIFDGAIGELDDPAVQAIYQHGDHPPGDGSVLKTF
jgi:phosphonate transport system ATP-binding protein